jgi:hypothetical protein
MTRFYVSSELDELRSLHKKLIVNEGRIHIDS